MLSLMIENPGAAAPESFTLFGATSKKRTTDKRMIGLFGSGAKHGVCSLLREGINTTIFCSTLKLSYYTESVYVTGVDGITKDHMRVCVKYGGRDESGRSRSANDKLSVTLDYGQHDWNSITLALREFISNAIDACYEQGKDHRYVRIAVVDESEIRACKGTTRVYIPLTQEVQRFHNHLGKWFLHFSEPKMLEQTMLPKNGRNQPKNDETAPIARACIYRRGVFVREFRSSSLPSLFDYNLQNLDLNESRTFNDWEAKHEIGKAVSAAPPDYLAKILKAMSKGEEFFEATLDASSLEPHWSDEEPVKEKKKENWNKAVQAVGGDHAVLVGSGVAAVSEMVTHKGFTPVNIKSDGWARAAASWGVKTEASVLTEDDLNGIRYSDATDDVRWALKWVWDILVGVKLINGKGCPDPQCFYKGVEAGNQIWGMYKDDVCHIHEQISTGKSDMLLETMMEEVCHHITGATDFSRDFQTHLIRVIVALAKKLETKS